jgi:protein gp37
MRGKNPNEKVAERYGGGECTSGGKWNGQVRLAPERVLMEPLQVKKPQVWAAWNDLFHKDVEKEWINDVFRVMDAVPRHTFLVLTKRPDRMKEYILAATDHCGRLMPPNIWLGVTVEHPDYLWRVEELLQTPAAKRFVSVEPMLGPVDLSKYLRMYIQPAMANWVIAGCESGPRRRPAKIEWFRSLRDQCVAAGTPYFLKQMEINGKVVKMPLLDGREWKEFPK